jgi:hypothetical protein
LPALVVVSMEIRNGFVPQWMADRLNGRKDDAATDHGVSITERGAADQGTDPRAFPTQTAAAGINVPVSKPEKDRTMQMSSSPGGRHSNPKGVHGGRPRRSFPRAQAHKLRKQGLSIRAIGARLGVPASTVADALKVTE